MRVATWNVNGIRAREAQVLELVAREAEALIARSPGASPTAGWSAR